MCLSKPRAITHSKKEKEMKKEEEKSHACITLIAQSTEYVLFTENKKLNLMH